MKIPSPGIGWQEKPRNEGLPGSAFGRGRLRFSGIVPVIFWDKMVRVIVLSLKITVSG